MRIRRPVRAGSDRRSHAPSPSSEARYRALVDALSEFVIVTNGRGEALISRSSWLSYTGQDERASSGLGWLDALHSDDRSSFERQWSEGTTVAGPFSVAGRLLHRSGEYRHCEGRVVPMRDPSGRVVEWVAAFSDVNDHHLAQERDRNTADRFRRIFAANVFGICYGEHRRILDANDAMLEMLGADRRELARGIPLEEIVVSDQLDVSSLPIRNGDSHEFEVRRKDGTSADLLAAGVSLAPDRGWLAVAVDVTQRKTSERENEHRALHDALTGLPNRRLLVDRLQHALNRAHRENATVGVLFCDLDRFKDINDGFGHAAGDAALQVVARRIHGELRECDTVAVPEATSSSSCSNLWWIRTTRRRVAERVRAVLATPVRLENRNAPVTCSIGVALSTGANDEVEALIGRADDAMYRAQARGPRPGRDRRRRARIPLRTPMGGARVETRARRRSTRTRVPTRHRPARRLPRRRRGAAALAGRRREHPDVAVIEVAEETGLIVGVTDWVISEACRQFQLVARRRRRARRDGSCT